MADPGDDFLLRTGHHPVYIPEVRPSSRADGRDRQHGYGLPPSLIRHLQKCELAARKAAPQSGRVAEPGDPQ